MNIYEQIDTIFSGEAEERPKWAGELLEEVREMKALLIEQKEFMNSNTYSNNTAFRHNRSGFYDFIKKFRASMQADVLNNIYPTFEYHGKKLGVDYSGLLYDKKTSKTLIRHEAFEVYKFAYNHRHKIQISAKTCYDNPQ